MLQKIIDRNSLSVTRYEEKLKETRGRTQRCAAKPPSAVGLLPSAFGLLPSAGFQFTAGGRWPADIDSRGAGG